MGSTLRIQVREPLPLSSSSGLRLCAAAATILMSPVFSDESFRPRKSSM
jgi:hypothetical protein